MLARHISHRSRDTAIIAFPAPSLRAADLHGLFAQQPILRLAPGATLLWEDERASDVFEVVHGALRIFTILGDGRRAIVRFAQPGDLIGLSCRGTYGFSIEAVSGVGVRRLARVSFERAVERSEDLQAELLAAVRTEATAAHQHAVLLARKNAEERVASFLLSLRDRTVKDARQAGQAISLPMTRLDMADFLGLTLETVSRVMTRLTRAGVIAAAGRHAVAILQPRKLKMLAGEAAEGETEISNLRQGRSHVAH